MTFEENHHFSYNRMIVVSLVIEIIAFASNLDGNALYMNETNHLFTETV